MNITRAKLEYLIKDEKKATQEYKELGLESLSRDEHGHMIFLTKLLKKMV